MKKAFVFALILSLAVTPALASSVDISSMTAEELFVLRNEIDNRLKEIGRYPYVQLQKGQYGTEVLSLQKRLYDLGYYLKDSTGSFDSSTASAYKAFEKANGIKQDGVASISEQEKLFSQEAIPKPTPGPNSPKGKTIKPTSTPDIRRNYEYFEYEPAARYSDENKGKLVRIGGTIIQALGSKETGFELRVATKNYYENIVYIYVKNAQFNLLENDMGWFFCRLDGLLTYESTEGVPVTLPLARCDFFDITGRR